MSRDERAAVAMADHTAGELAAMVVDLEDEVTLLTHKVITCGVAASHPDASLSRRGAYGSTWDSPQAEEVRTLRALAEKLAGALADLLAVAQSAMREANGDGAGWIVDQELTPARAALSEYEASKGGGRG